MSLLTWEGQLLSPLTADPDCCCDVVCICVCYWAEFICQSDEVLNFDDCVDDIIAAVKAEAWPRNWEWVSIGECGAFDIYGEPLYRSVHVNFKCCTDPYERSQIVDQDSDPCLDLALSDALQDFAAYLGISLNEIGSSNCDPDTFHELAELQCDDTSVDPSYSVYTRIEDRVVDCDYPS